MITQEECAYGQAQIQMVAALALMIPAEGMIEMIDRAEAVGPIVDPALWREAGDKMLKLRELLVALRKFQQVVESGIREFGGAET